MRPIISLTMCLALALASLPLAGCDTAADKGATPPKDKMATPAKGPMSGGGADQAKSAGSSAPQVLPPPPEK
jgi:hypothetical protein